MWAGEEGVHFVEYSGDELPPHFPPAGPNSQEGFPTSEGGGKVGVAVPCSYVPKFGKNG